MAAKDNRQQVKIKEIKMVTLSRKTLLVLMVISFVGGVWYADEKDKALGVPAEAILANPDISLAVSLPSCVDLALKNADKMNQSVARNQWLALHVASKEGLNKKQTIALFTALFVESGFHNWASAKVPSSQAFLNDGVKRGDHDSVGVLQQRVGYDGRGFSKDWGTVNQAMNPVVAMTSFAKKAKNIRGQESHSPGWLAQKVQVSAYPQRYVDNESQSAELLERMLQGCRMN